MGGCNSTHCPPGGMPARRGIFARDGCRPRGDGGRAPDPNAALICGNTTLPCLCQVVRSNFSEITSLGLGALSHVRLSSLEHWTAKSTGASVLPSSYR